MEKNTFVIKNFPRAADERRRESRILNKIRFVKY